MQGAKGVKFLNCKITKNNRDEKIDKNESNSKEE